MRIKLVISKKWHHPEFLYIITNEEMSAAMDMEDFKKALKKEIGSIIEFKKETFDKILDESIDKIISGLKEASAQAI